MNDTLAAFNITQTDLARVAGYGREYVNRVLRGRVVPSLQSCLVLDEALERLTEAEEV